MKISIHPDELQPGDVYQGKRIVYVSCPLRSQVTIVQFEKANPAAFDNNGLIEVDRIVERIEG